MDDAEKNVPLNSSAKSYGDGYADSKQPRRTIILIDDDADSNEMMSALLEMEGFSVTSEVNGLSGLNSILRQRPDTVLIDISLPGLNGHEVAAAVREQIGPEIQLIALTGHGRSSDIAKSMDAGFNNHLVKPVCMDSLMALLV